MRRMFLLASLFAVFAFLICPIIVFGQDELAPEHVAEAELAPGEVEYVVNVGLIERITNWTAGVLGTVLAGWYVAEELDVNDKDPDPDKQAAAEQAVPPVAPVGEYSITITGTFLGSQTVVECGSFIPGLTFSPEQPGVISAVLPSTCQQATTGGQWRPGYGTEIVLAVPDPFYAGIARVSGTDIILPSGAVLRASPGASITVTRRDPINH